LAEEKLRRSEQELSDFFENATIGLHWVGPDGTVLRVNQAELDMLGYHRDEYIGRHIAEFHAERSAIDDVLERLKRGERVQDYPARLRCKDGSIRDVLINSSALFEDGKFIHTRCFTRDITERKQAEQSLREDEARLSLTQQVAKIGTFEWNIQTGVNIWSPELEKLYGLKPGEFAKTQSAFEQLVHPDDLAEVLNRVARSFGTAASTDAEWRVVWPDGAVHWLAGYWQVFKDAAGMPWRMVGVNIDITERKQAETTQQTLLNELNHRVKNTLASVQAIAQQTLARTRDPADFVASFGGRIQSLARVHSMLSTTTWQGADLRELIRDQVLSGPVDDTRFTAWGPAVRLGPQVALHLALMLHELGTNSCKYGALSAPNGWVTVSWTTDDALHLQWVEHGGPPVVRPSRRGFGFSLIEQSAQGQGGEAHMRCEPEGITWTIKLPLQDRTSRSIAPQIVQTTLSERRAAGVAPQTSLAGRRFLIVEDEALVGLDIVDGLEDAQAQVEGPVGTPEQAIEIIERASLDGALLDANLHGRPVDEIASALTRRNVPFVFVTGHGTEGLPEAFRDVAILSKPFSRRQMLDAAAQLLTKRGDVVRLRR
jgi:PAS domain S-box-containing protein